MNEIEKEELKLTNEPEVKEENEVKKDDEVVEETPITPESTKVESEVKVESDPTEGDTRTPEGGEKMIPQSEVNRLVGTTRQEAREKARAELRDEVKQEVMREFFEKFGVQDEAEMDSVFGKGQQYDILNDDYTRQGNDFAAVREENVLLKSEVTPEKWEDAKLILKGKGLEITPENIENEIATHPEWRGAVEQMGQVEEKGPALKLFGESVETPKVNDEESVLKKYFNV